MAEDSYAALLWKRAEGFASAGEWPEAIAAFQELASIRPNDANVVLQLSYVHSLAGRYRVARDLAVAASEIPERRPEVVRELVSRLRTFNAVPELRRTIERLSPLSSMSIPLLMACAAQYSYLNEQERALELLDEAKRADPDFPPAIVARAQVLMYLGKFDEAEAEIKRSQRRAPEIAQGWSVLAKLRRQAPNSNHVSQIRQLLQRGRGRPQESALLLEALHKELDDLERYPDAWQALVGMCGAKRPTLAYEPTSSVEIVDLLCKASTRSAVSMAASERTPIFITGMHRSGTTLLEQLLDGHSDVRGVGELYDFTSQMRYATDHHCRGVIDRTIIERSETSDLAAVGEGYLKGMEWRLGRERFFTDKLPSNFLNIGFICRALPQAKILHMVRDPIETCFSNLRELFSDANPYSYDQLELADFYKQYRRLMAHWHQAYPGRILDVDYTELTRDTETVLRRVSVFCGFEFEPEMLALQNRKRGVATASAVQVRDKVVVRERPKWKPYEQYLQPLIQALRAEGFVE